MAGSSKAIPRSADGAGPEDHAAFRGESRGCFRRSKIGAFVMPLSGPPYSKSCASIQTHTGNPSDLAGAGLGRRGVEARRKPTDGQGRLGGSGLAAWVRTPISGWLVGRGWVFLGLGRPPLQFSKSAAFSWGEGGSRTHPFDQPSCPRPARFALRRGAGCRCRRRGEGRTPRRSRWIRSQARGERSNRAHRRCVSTLAV